MKFVARQSEDIQDDIKRNWSSWNFGLGGFNGTYEELQEYLATITDENCITISHLDIYTHNIKSFEFGELYENYWVVIDRMNARDGLSAISLDSDNLQDAIEEAKTGAYFGDGIGFDAKDYKLVASIANNIHIFQSLYEY